MQAVCGFVLDYLGLRLGFSLFGIAWSLFNIMHAFAGGWVGLAIFRGLLGLSEAAAIPAGIKADLRMVSGKRTLGGGRLLQRGHFAWSLVRAAVSHLDFVAARLANGFCRYRLVSVLSGLLCGGPSTVHRSTSGCWGMRSART